MRVDMNVSLKALDGPRDRRAHPRFPTASGHDPLAGESLQRDAMHGSADVVDEDRDASSAGSFGDRGQDAGFECLRIELTAVDRLDPGSAEQLETICV